MPVNHEMWQEILRKIKNNEITELNFQPDISPGQVSDFLIQMEISREAEFIFCTDIPCDGFKDLAEALKVNNSVVYLNIFSLDMISPEAHRNIGKNKNIIREGMHALAEAIKENKCLTFYKSELLGFGIWDAVWKNEQDNRKLAIVINSEFNSYLDALLYGGSINASSELNLQDLKQRVAAINYILQARPAFLITKQSDSATKNAEVVIFCDIAAKKLRKSENYNSINEFFEEAITELAMQLNEGYYKHSKDYPKFFIRTRFRKFDDYLSEYVYPKDLFDNNKISDEAKEKLLRVPAVVLYNASMGAYKQGNHEEALKNLEQAQVKAPGEPRIMLEKAKVLYLLGCFQQADEELAEALGNSFNTTDKLIEMHDWFEERGERTKATALKDKQELLKDAKYKPELSELAIKQLKDSCHKEALNMLDKLIAVDFREFSAYHLKAKLHYILADSGFDKVIKAGEEKAKPKPAEYYKLADWLDKHADTSRAYEYNIKADKLSDQAFLAKIYTNWFKQHSDFQKDISALPGEINYLRSDSIKHAKELDELEEVIDIREEEDIQMLGDYPQAEVSEADKDLLGINPEVE